MSEENKDKQNKPTARKLEQLKKEGSFLRARELYAGVTLIAGLIALYAFYSLVQKTWVENFKLIFSKLDIYSHNDFLLKELISQLLFKNLLTLLPFFILIMSIFLLSVSIFGGLSFSSKLIRFKGERLSPNKNLKRIYSMQALIEIAKSLLKVMLFFLLLYIFFQAHGYEILSLSRVGTNNTLQYSTDLFKKFLIQMIGGVGFIALIDALINYFQYHKKAMMSHQEIKDESKESDGNPEIKRKIRQAQHALSMQRLQKEMPKASVVLVNPTHYAVALRYLEKKDSAPVIIARGVDHKALQIRQLAIKHGVPIYQSPELTRAIYHSSKVGTMIAPELYMAVAIVLSYILQLKEYQVGRGAKPAPLNHIEIPEQFKSKI